MIIPIIFSIVLGYLLGSIPFALVIGKLFYKTDIRQYGSGNLGGGNAGRVLGKKAGVAVMALDILKVTLAIFLASLMSDSQELMALAGLSSALGHCFPIFARFKGGKAVATMYGFLLGMVIIAGHSPLLFVLPLVIFVIILFITQIIALSSIGSAIAVLIYSAIFEGSLILTGSIFIFTIIIIVRHRANLVRIKNREENKVTWVRIKNKKRAE